MTHGLKVLAAAAVLAIGSAGAASAAAGVNVGQLRCTVAAGAGFIIGSNKKLDCTYKPVKGPVQHYTGNIGKLGLDIGFTGKSHLVWTVIAPSTNLKKGSLAGTYVGASAQATAGAGVGANALVGGFNKQIALQPISLQTQTGANIAAGVTKMTLHQAS